jgi:hypothetical protein
MHDPFTNIIEIRAMDRKLELSYALIKYCYTFFQGIYMNRWIFIESKIIWGCYKR